MTDDNDAEIIVTVHLNRNDESVRVQVVEPGEGERDETFTDERTVMGVYVCMEILLNVLEGKYPNIVDVGLN